jgi:hypothetical protein
VRERLFLGLSGVSCHPGGFGRYCPKGKTRHTFRRCGCRGGSDSYHRCSFRYSRRCGRDRPWQTGWRIKSVAGDVSEFIPSASRRSCRGNLDKHRITAQGFRQSGTKGASTNHSIGHRSQRIQMRRNCERIAVWRSRISLYFIYGIPTSVTRPTASSVQTLSSTEDSSTSAPVGDAGAPGCGFPNAIFIQEGIDLASFGRT